MGHRSFWGSFIETASATSAIELGFFFRELQNFFCGNLRIGLTESYVWSGQVWVLRNAASQRLKGDTSPPNGNCRGYLKFSGILGASTLSESATKLFL